MTTRTGWRVLAVGVVWGAMACPAMLGAKTKLPVPSTWELDQLRSDFGGGPKMASEVFTVNEDKPALLSMDFVVVDGAGQTAKSSWSGPQNGKMLPLSGSSGVSFGIDKEGNEHWLFADGSTRVGKMSLEKDKRTVLLRVVYTGRDGKQYNQVLMYNRTDQ
jgi:hypothetical protein